MSAITSVLVAALLLSFAPSHVAWAHASMVKSTPANGAVLKQVPAVIQATFSEELDKASVIRLYDGAQKELAKGGLDMKVAGHRVLTVTPPHLAAGKYTVRWVAISSDDGAQEKGSFGFSVAATAMAPMAGMSDPPALKAGTHTIKVFWADNKTHAAAGAVQTVTCKVTG